MDDFLHNLRSGNLKQSDRNRRQYGESHQYKGPQRRTGAERRKREQENGLQSEALLAIKDLLKHILDNQKKMAEVLEERNRSEERKAEALEQIAKRLDRLPFETKVDAVKAAPVAPIAPVAPKPKQNRTIRKKPVHMAIQTKYSKKINDAGLLICRLRDEGFSYAKIADTLEAKGIPTVSGKGRWRGQSVQRLYLKVSPELIS
ncbi:MAG: hypothetical protein PVI90_05665 [Desulfobacteraceae bacterium]|jgi:hypothetical protein